MQVFIPLKNQRVNKSQENVSYPLKILICPFGIFSSVSISYMCGLVSFCCAAWLTFIVRSYEIAVMAWMGIRIHNKITFWFFHITHSCKFNIMSEQWSADSGTEDNCIVRLYSFIHINLIQSVNYILQKVTSRLNCVMLFHIHSCCCCCLQVATLLIDANVSMYLTVDERKEQIL